MLTTDDLAAIARVVASLSSGNIPPPQLARQLEWVDSLVTLNSPGGSLCQANANRVLLSITPDASNLGWMTPAGTRAASSGIALQNGGLAVIFTVHQHGILPQLEWVLNQGTFTSTFYILEIIWRPPA